MPSTKPATIDEYIRNFPKDVQQVLRDLRTLIRAVAPQMEEKISYGIPTFTLEGQYVIYFAGYKHHFSIYPTPGAPCPFEDDLVAHRSGKGTAKFELGKPLPTSLIESLVRYQLKRIQKD